MRKFTRFFTAKAYLLLEQALYIETAQYSSPVTCSKHIEKQSKHN
jgi:hypothetical protein